MRECDGYLKTLVELAFFKSLIGATKVNIICDKAEE